MKLILEKVDVFRLLGKSLDMKLTDETVEVHIDAETRSFELHLNDVSTAVVEPPPPNQSVAIQLEELLSSALKEKPNVVEQSPAVTAEPEPEPEPEILKNLTPTEKMEQERERANKAAIARLDAANTEPMTLGTLLNPNPPPASPDSTSKSTGYRPPPLSDALKASNYFSDTEDNEDSVHFDHPGATTEAELNATRGKTTAEDLAETERMIQNAK